MDDNDFPQKLAVQRESLRVLDEAVRNSPDNVTLRDLSRAGPPSSRGHTDRGRKGRGRSPRLSGFGSDHRTLLEARTRVAARAVRCRSNQRLALNAVTRARRADALVFAERALHTRENPSVDVPSVRAGPRGCSAMALTYAALPAGPVRQPGDREDALSSAAQSCRRVARGSVR